MEGGRGGDGGEKGEGGGGKWRPWLAPVLPKGYWDDSNNQRNFFVYSFSLSLLFPSFSFSFSLFSSLSQFSISISPVLPPSPWNRYLGEVLGYSKPEDYYGLTRLKIIEHGGASLLSKYLLLFLLSLLHLFFLFPPPPPPPPPCPSFPFPFVSSIPFHLSL